MRNSYFYTLTMIVCRLLFVTSLYLIGSTYKAEAFDWTFCNRTQSTVYLAVGWSEGADGRMRRSKGWFQINRGQCFTLSDKNYPIAYYYARSRFDVWEGTNVYRRFCILRHARFDLVDYYTLPKCRGDNFEAHSFIHIEEPGALDRDSEGRRIDRSIINLTSNFDPYKPGNLENDNRAVPQD